MNVTDVAEPSVEIASVAAVLISCFAFTVNTLSLITLSKCVKMDNRIRLMIRNISMADGFLGCIPVLVLMIDNFGLKNSIAGCYLKLILARFMTFAKLFSVSIIAVDRCICLYFANLYLKYVSGQVTFVVILVTWITSLFLTVGSCVGNISFNTDCLNENQSDGFNVVLIVSVLCGLLITGAYIGVYQNIKKHERNMKALNNSETSQASFYRSTVILFLLVFVFILCYIPTGIYRTVIYLNPELLFQTGGIRNITNIIFLSSTFIDPLLYVLRFTECRVLMAKMICWLNREYVEKLDRKQKQTYASYLPTKEIPATELQTTLLATITLPATPLPTTPLRATSLPSTPVPLPTTKDQSRPVPPTTPLPTTPLPTTELSH